MYFLPLKKKNEEFSFSERVNGSSRFSSFSKNKETTIKLDFRTFINPLRTKKKFLRSGIQILFCLVFLFIFIFYASGPKISILIAQKISKEKDFSGSSSDSFSFFFAELSLNLKNRKSFNVRNMVRVFDIGETSQLNLQKLSKNFVCCSRFSSQKKFFPPNIL